MSFLSPCLAASRPHALLLSSCRRPAPTTNGTAIKTDDAGISPNGTAVITWVPVLTQVGDGILIEDAVINADEALIRADAPALTQIARTSVQASAWLPQ